MRREHPEHLLTAYLLGELTEKARLEVEKHLAQCSSCREELSVLRRTISLLAETLGKAPEQFSLEERRRIQIIYAARRARSSRWRYMRAAVGVLIAAACFVVLAAFLGPSIFVQYREVPKSAVRFRLRERLPVRPPVGARLDLPAVNAEAPAEAGEGAVREVGVLAGRISEHFEPAPDTVRHLVEGVGLEDSAESKTEDATIVTGRRSKWKVKPDVAGAAGSEPQAKFKKASVVRLGDIDVNNAGAQARAKEAPPQVAGNAAVGPGGGNTGFAARPRSENLLRRAAARRGLQQAQFMYQPGQAPQRAVVLEASPLNKRRPTGNPSEQERLLRGYAYWRSVDPRLSFEAYAARPLAVPPPPIDDEGLGREGFRKRYGVNPFMDTTVDCLSTFGMDVDTASFTRIRSELSAGRLPDPREVRIEECINFFPDPRPTEPGRDFTLFCEGGPSPFGAGLELLALTVKARKLTRSERKPVLLTFAIDTSGSMAAQASAEDPELTRLDLVKTALKNLLESLRPQDRVALVGFGRSATLLLPPTPVHQRKRIADAIDSLLPAGPTNVEAGLDLAYRVADQAFDSKAVNRVVLCTDGVATVGPSGPEEMLSKVKAYAGRGILLSCIGVGMGKYNDAMLETLADKGNGNYAYVDNPWEAEKIFRRNLPGVLYVVAKDAKVQVVFNPAVVSCYRLLGYENRDIADQRFRDDSVDAGEVGPGATVTVLYEILRYRSTPGPLGRIYLRYCEADTGRVREVNYALSQGVIATELKATSDRFRFIACVAEMAELLRRSVFARDGSFAAVLEVLDGLSAEFKSTSQYRTVREMVKKAQELTLRRLFAVVRTKTP